MTIWKALRITGFLATALCVLTLIGFASDHRGFENVIAHYPFDGTAEDISENGLHGLIEGATSVAGIVGQALLFDGVNDFVEIPVAAFNGISRGSVSFWIRPESAPLNREVAFFGGWDVMYKETFKHETISGVRIDLDGKLRCTHHNFWIGTGEDLVSRFMLQQGAWTHVVWAWNLDGQYLYLNGSRVSSNDTRDGVASDSYGWVRFGMGGTYFSGALDDIWIFRDWLSPIDVLRLMEMGAHSD